MDNAKLSRYTFGAVYLVALLSTGCRDKSPGAAADSTLSPDTAATQHDSAMEREEAKPMSHVVRTDMQHVNMHVEPGIVLGINRLHGILRSTHKGEPPALNIKSSMLIEIESADIFIDTLSLANLLNRHVFAYANSPLRKLHVSIGGDQMIQTGALHKGTWLPFRIRSTLSVTPSGEIRAHPTAVSVMGIGVKGLSKSLGGLSKLIKLEPGHGARLEGDDFILNPAEMLPPPSIRGKLASVTVEAHGLRQIFGAEHTIPLRRAGSTAKNYMYFHGGTLRFGKLTMNDTDLEIVDGNQDDPFDYALDRYRDHLVAGHSNTTRADGLIVVMPDLQKLK